MLSSAIEAVQTNPPGTGALSDFEKALQALAALAVESPDAQHARLEARRRIASMGAELSTMAQQLGYVQTWIAGVLPDVPNK